MRGVAPASFEVELRDGTPVRLRAIHPGDKERLATGLTRLSQQSRYLRFFSPIRSLSERDLAYLTEVDYADHMAWCAVDPQDPGERLLGVARYVRDAARPEVAEVAIVVGDPYQGRGLGTILLGALGQTAAENGVRAFSSEVLAGNQQVARLVEELGGKVRSRAGGLLQVETPVAAGAEHVPDTPAGRVVRSVAQGMLEARASLQSPED